MPNMTNYKPEDITPAMRKYLGMPEAAQDAGTSEGSKKGRETRRNGASYALGGHEGAVYRDFNDQTDGGDVDAAFQSKFKAETGKDPYDENGEETDGFADYKYATFLDHMRKTPSHDPRKIAESVKSHLGLGIGKIETI